jgi:cytochrome c-type biogenesis protein CcmH
MLLADYADVLIRLNGGRYDGKPGELIDRALKLNPDEPMALYLAGAAASDRQDYAAVVHFWERLMPQLEAGSEDARNIGGALDEARKMLGIGGPPAASLARAANPGPAQAPADASTVSGPEAISGEVVLSGKLAAQAQPDDTLFIFARAEEGSRMPLAVMRKQVADLPLSFNLDDSMGLPGGKKISEFPSVVIEARVAKAGMAQSASGDLFGTLKGVKPGSKVIKLVIDQVQP